MIFPLINTFFYVYYLMLLVRIFMSWMPVNQYSKWVITIEKLTDPYLDLFRKFIPPYNGFDFSPILAIFALDIIKRIVLTLLVTTGLAMF